MGSNLWKAYWEISSFRIISSDKNIIKGYSKNRVEKARNKQSRNGVEERGHTGVS